MREYTQRLNVYLLKDDVTTFDEALRRPEKWDGKNGNPKAAAFILPGSTDARLYGDIARGTRPPKWVTFLEPGIKPGESNPFDNFLSGTPGALLLVKLSVKDSNGADVTKWFALTYGFGRSFLRDSCWEPRFGLRIALNAVPEDQLRQAHLRNHDGHTVQKSVSISRLGGLRAFGFDSEQDMLEKLTAKLPKGDDLGIVLSGSDSVSITVKTGLPELCTRLNRLYDAWMSDAWKSKFPEVLSIQPIKDKMLIGELCDQLVNDLNQGSDRIHMACPEIIDYDDRFASYLYESFDAPDEGSCDELSVSALKPIKEGDELTLESLRLTRISIVDADGLPIKGPWTALQCLVAEIEWQGRLCVLTGGEWFECDRDFVSALDRFVDEIPPAGVLDPHPGAADEREDAYITRISKLQDTNLICGHKRTLYYGPNTAAGGQSQIELCDLLKEHCELPGLPNRRHCWIHIKQSNNAGALGHLFNQGVVALDLLVGDLEFAEKARKYDGGCFAGVVSDSPKCSDYAIVFAIMTPQTAPFRSVLTLFSKVVLRRAVKQLQLRGCAVYLDRIKT